MLAETTEGALAALRSGRPILVLDERRRLPLVSIGELADARFEAEWAS